MSSSLIAKLLKAEEEAESIVAGARDNRVKALRDARSAALEEIEAYRAKEEEAFNQKLAAMNQTSANESNAMNTQKELAQVAADANKDKAISYIYKKVMDVQTQLSQIRSRRSRPRANC